MKQLRFSLRSMMWIVTCVAMFCAGYLTGYDSGLNARFEPLLKLISDVTVPDWDSPSDRISTSATNGCTLLVREAESTDDPFAPANTFDPKDPFATVSPKSPQSHYLDLP